MRYIIKEYGKEFFVKGFCTIRGDKTERLELTADRQDARIFYTKESAEYLLRLLPDSFDGIVVRYENKEEMLLHYACISLTIVWLILGAYYILSNHEHGTLYFSMCMLWATFFLSKG